ncbi:hypothetical protein [Pedobacter sp. UC225_65]|uniref:hypothetical protein n=1 Tax=Pedobacter sp. UC225_65 TaxID=3350173 RepID=UPI0036706132
METLLQQLNYQPTGLTDDEIAHPEDALGNIFYTLPLHVARANIRLFYQAWVLHNAPTADAQDTTEMLAFVNGLINLVELSYVVVHRHEQVENAMVFVGKYSA